MHLVNPSQFIVLGQGHRLFLALSGRSFKEASDYIRWKTVSMARHYSAIDRVVSISESANVVKLRYREAVF